MKSKLKTSRSKKINLKILIINGVNLDLLGLREPDIYGKQTLQDLENYLKGYKQKICPVMDVELCELFFYQTNNEHLFLEKLTEFSWDGILVNAGAWTHTSIAIADRLKGINIPYIELHLSHLDQREGWRSKSYLSKNSLGVIYGLGFSSYSSGLSALLEYLSKVRKANRLS